MLIPRLLLAVLLPLTLGLIACGGDADEEREPAPSVPLTMLQGQSSVGGEQIELSSILGAKPVVLNFWAGLCPPCRAEMPDFQAFYDDYQDRVLLVGIDVGRFTSLGSQDDAVNLLSELGVTYPAGYTKDPEVLSKYRVFGIPATVFIDGEGNIFAHWSGALNEETLREMTNNMLEG